MRTGEPVRWLLCFGGAVAVHLAALPWLAPPDSGHGDAAGPTPATGIALAWVETEVPVIPSAVARSAPAPSPPRAALARPSVRRTPPEESAKGTGGTTGAGGGPPTTRRSGRRTATPAPAPSSPAVAPTSSSGTEAGEAPATGVPGSGLPVGSPQGDPSGAPADPAGSPEAAAGCDPTMDGFACSPAPDPTVLNRDRVALGMVVEPGYRERSYDLRGEGDELVWRPDGHNAIHVRPDGSLVEESGPRATDLLCILGGAPLPWDIPTIPQYQYAEFEAATADLRRNLADQDDRSRTAEALGGLRTELLGAIERRGGTDADRRRFLFLRWDECTEDGSGLEARSIIEAVARERFPAGTAAAYSDAELETLNRSRNSRNPFAPYDR